MHRTKLTDRKLPTYSRGEEIMNMVTHIIGGALGVIVLAAGLFQSISHGSIFAVVGSCVYGVSMIALYTVSSVYHGMSPGTGKKVMQIIDHCTIYFLIAGTYTPILLSAFIPHYPTIGWTLLIAQWVLAAIAATLTAIDLRQYRVFSMICYILMGWAIIFFLPQALDTLGISGFGLLLTGGVIYTIGAVFYGIGSNIPWFHSVFHVFVVLGSFFQFLSIILYVL